LHLSNPIEYKLFINNYTYGSFLLEYVFIDNDLHEKLISSTNRNLLLKNSVFGNHQVNENHFKTCKPYLYDFLDDKSKDIPLNNISFEEFMMVFIKSLYIRNTYFLKKIIKNEKIIQVHNNFINDCFNYFCNKKDMEIFDILKNLKPKLSLKTVMKNIYEENYEIINIIKNKEIEINNYDEIDDEIRNNIIKINPSMIYSLYKFGIFTNYLRIKPYIFERLQNYLISMITRRKYLLKIMSEEIKFLPPYSNFIGGIEYQKIKKRFKCLSTIEYN